MAHLLTTLRTFRSWQKIRLSWLIMAVVFCGVLGIGGVLALRVLRSPAPAEILPGQTLANDIAAAVARGTGVQTSTGAYVPGDRLILFTRLDETEVARVRTWAIVQLDPFTERLATMPSDETLTWVIEYGPPPAQQEVLIAPLRRADSPAAYTYISAAPALLTAPTAVATAAAAAPINPPAPVPTAAPVATAPAVAPVIPAATPAIATELAPGVVTPLVTSAFEGEGQTDPLWRSLAGDWVMDNGVYTQRNTDGYDFLSLLDLPPQAHYSIETQLRLDSGTMGGGIIYNVPEPTRRNGAQLVDFDESGAFVRWGHYDADGTYRYDGGAALDPGIGDGQWHTLRVVTHGATSTIWVDEREVAQVRNLSVAGHVGLSTSQAQVSFDDVAVLALPEGVNPPTPAASTQADASVTSLSDDFADGDAKGWQVLNGTWQNLEGTYRQTSTSGADLSSVSLFQGDNYTATVRLQRLDGTMGGGLLFNMARRDNKSRSQIVNYTQDGTVLQWGHFDEGGNFVFEGSAEVPDGSDEAWHTLALSVAEGKLTIMLDDEIVATDVELAYTGGYVGLVASNSSVAFDDVAFVAQQE
ncbi:family 16 glycoside hydrolase [Candidatus Chloroploca sp. Khr17]|uniref:family 16 glycoside hydrolase n=1 Tax=Candidatus Chloroploca sp. Khr17 TaxID=2496869 RepID=UPI0013EDD509|nr:family 16 glycoside hydrolase [Candidatus Chloroploca sp. Khr17]